jgi:peptidoglycan-associated lipoprotein
MPRQRSGVQNTFEENPKMFSSVQSRQARGLVAMLLAMVLAYGCSSSGAPEEPAAPPVAPDPVETTEPVTPPDTGSADFGSDGNPIWPGTNRPLDRIFYFEYDRSVLKPADLAALDTHAKILRRNPDRQVVIEGHCDERGTREYNLALGERRADSIRSYLTSSGVAARQMETVSYGEERPTDPGHDDSAWSRNRRAVLQYR